MTVASSHGSRPTAPAYPVEVGGTNPEFELPLDREEAAEQPSETTPAPSAAPDHMNNTGTRHSPSASWGYETRLTYQVIDDTGAVMSGYDVNERWSTGVVNDITPCDWRRGPPGAFHVAGSSFDDLIGGESAGHTPTPLAPSGGSTRVQHWGQEWYVGSLTPGRGTLVQTNTLQKYQDHATHDGVTSPPSLASRGLAGARQTAETAAEAVMSGAARARRFLGL